MSKKRIAIIIDSLAGGGAEKVMLTLANELIKQGHEPHLLVLFENCQHHIEKNIPVHFCFDKKKDKHLGSFWNTKRYARRLDCWIKGLEGEVGDFDLFISNLDKANLLMSHSKVSPLYFVVHSSIEEPLKRTKKLGPIAYFKMLRAKKALNGKHLITVSEGIKQEIERVGRIVPASITTIYNPCDLEEVRDLSQESTATLPKGDYLIHVGRFAKPKRHDVLFQALKLMDNNLPLVLLCNNVKKATKIAKKYGVLDRVIMPGFQQNPYPWIKGAKVLVLSSDYEGLGMVLIESLVCQTPVVSTDCEHGPNEILTGDLARFLVPRRDPESLALKVDEALDSYPQITDIDLLKQVDAHQVCLAYLDLINQK
ncbi:glycosyltransferase [Shewanella schlegeliana]|uniref:Glycosyltransferase n=1 Tax=Shewanella schlegeliana TaxID=190308 RepID=A0ABS1T3A9_9GAMM|nr:glycosyltransferase [Shewanella schlegeliana]MBL4915262.1 glycosyltransferase [Shewanella schlegeliana]MCL1111227.1 glycosyltransferase [Shewanella schlegeliana]GIU34110.1 glycosyl transferase [Shewanella schlegeliana]